MDFISKLPLSLKDEITKIFFFNNNQWKYHSSIEQAIIEYGPPKISEENSFLSIGIEGNSLPQTLFAVDSSTGPNIVFGVLIYFRIAHEQIKIIHLATSEPKINQNEVINALDIISSFIHLIQRLKGITSIILPYSNIQIKINQ